MKTKYILPIASAMFFLASCGGGGNESLDDKDSLDQVNDLNQKLNTQKVFYNIPSPIETADLLKETNSEYDASMLNDPMLYNSYATDDKRAMNLGVYGADLSYTSIYNNTSESMLFLKCVNQLSKKLGIAKVFDEHVSTRIEQNKDNRDSLLSIISSSFWEADAFLKENDRPHTSSLLVTGGWIEGLYLACSVGSETKNPKVLTRIAEQKLSLEDLIALLNTVKLDDKSKFVLDELVALKAIYDKVTLTPGNATVKTDTTKGITTLGGKSTNNLDEALLTEIKTKVADIRKKITTP